MDAASLVEEHCKLRGTIEGDQVEVTGAEACGKHLLMLLCHINERKADVPRRKGEQIVNDGSVEFAMSLERRVQR